MESEKDTEKYLIEQIELLGGMCRKFTCPNVRGVVDQICLLPKGIVKWVEVKSENEKPKDHQVREINRMKERGHDARVIDDKNGVNQLIKEIRYELFRCI